MGILLPQMVDVLINGGNVNYLLSKGYTIPTHRSKWKYKKDGYVSYNLGDTIPVSVNHLRPKSHVKVKFLCDRCGTTFEREMALYTKRSKDGKTYCTKCCMIGEASALYKQDMSDETRKKHRNYYEYKEFRQNVFARDNYTCQCCGFANESDVELHHLNSYSNCEEDRTNMDNAVTLCHDCHTAFHDEYGKGNTTRQQFYEWIRIVHSQRIYDGKVNPYRPVYCFENDTLYKSPQECAADCGIKKVGKIYQICNQSKTVYSLKGKHFMWGDLYQKMTKAELKDYFHENFTNPKFKKVVCLGDSSVYMSATEAGRHYNLGHKVVLHSCEKKNTKRSLGVLPNGNPITFAYYDDYISMSKSDIDKINSSVENGKLRRQIINTKTNTVYKNPKDVYSSCNISCYLLKKYCDEARNGIYTHDWMYCDDYIKLKETEQ